MIKNFIVKVKPIKHKSKGIINLLNYLVDNKRHQDGIINYKKFDKNTFIKKTIINVDKKNLENKINRRGGRPIQSYGDSFIYSLPVDTKVDKKQLNKIIHQLLIKNYEYIKEQYQDLDYNTFVNSVFVNIHTNKHIHINFIIPKVFNVNNKLITNTLTNRKGYLYYTKTLFNNVLNNVIGLDHKTYKARTNFKSGYKNIYQKNIILKKNEEQLKKITEEKEKLKNTYEKIFKNMSIYLKRSMDGLVNNEIEKYNKNIKLFKKKYDLILSKLNYKEKIQQQKIINSILKENLNNDTIILLLRDTKKLQQINENLNSYFELN